MTTPIGHHPAPPFESNGTPARPAPSTGPPLRDTEERAPAGRRWAAGPVSIAVGALVLLQAYVLYYSFNYGVWSGLLQWDDCAVFLRGLVNLDAIAHLHSAFAILRSVPALHIHAPLSDVQTIIGLLLSGGREWGPFVLNALPVGIAVLAILFIPERSTGMLFAALLVFLLLQPLTINSLTYIKSDWKGGVLIAPAVFLLNEAAERQSARLKLAGAAMLGFAITSKLTAFYLPVLAVAILVIYEAYGVLVRREQQRAAMPDRAALPLYDGRDARLLARCSALAVAPFALFFAVYAAPTVRYIRYDLAGTWDDGLTTLGRAAYYSPLSADGAAAWGNLHLCFLLFAGACVVIAIGRRSYRSLVSVACVLLVALMFLAPLIVPKTSNITFCATLLGVVMGGTVIAIRAFARAIPRWGSVAALVLVLAVVLRSPMPLSNSAYGPTHAPAPAQLRVLASRYDEIERIIQTSSAARPRVLVFYLDLFAPHPNLAIRFFERTGRLLSADRVDDVSNGAVAGAALERTNFALTFVPADGARLSRELGGANEHIPLSMHPAMADAFVSREPGFALVRSIPAPGGEIHVYRNRRLEPDVTETPRDESAASTSGRRPAARPTP